MYDTDYNKWLHETIEQIKFNNFNRVDWNHVIEELESLGKSEQRELFSLTYQIVLHQLKLKYLKSELDRNQKHWEIEVDAFQSQLDRLLQDSPSLKNKLPEVQDKALKKARLKLSKSFDEVPADANLD